MAIFIHSKNFAAFGEQKMKIAIWIGFVFVKKLFFRLILNISWHRKADEKFLNFPWKVWRWGLINIPLHWLPCCFCSDIFQSENIFNMPLFRSLSTSRCRSKTPTRPCATSCGSRPSCAIKNCCCKKSQANPKCAIKNCCCKKTMSCGKCRGACKCIKSRMSCRSKSCDQPCPCSSQCSHCPIAKKRYSLCKKRSKSCQPKCSKACSKPCCKPKCPKTCSKPCCKPKKCPKSCSKPCCKPKCPTDCPKSKCQQKTCPKPCCESKCPKECSKVNRSRSKSKKTTKDCEEPCCEPDPFVETSNAATNDGCGRSGCCSRKPCISCVKAGNVAKKSKCPVCKKCKCICQVACDCENCQKPPKCEKREQYPSACEERRQQLIGYYERDWRSFWGWW